MATQRRYGVNIKSLKNNTIHCFYCGKKMSERNKTIDHIVPIKNGGSNCIDNIVICCRRCNGFKGGYTVSELIEQLKKRYKFADEKSRKKLSKEMLHWNEIKGLLKEGAE